MTKQEKILLVLFIATALGHSRAMMNHNLLLTILFGISAIVDGILFILLALFILLVAGIRWLCKLDSSPDIWLERVANEGKVGWPDE